MKKVFIFDNDVIVADANSGISFEIDGKEANEVRIMPNDEAKAFQEDFDKKHPK
jgi:hypothetical protein